MKTNRILIPAALLLLALADGALAQLSNPQTPGEAPMPGSRYAQRAKAANDPNNRSKRPEYAKKFDLGGLPHYVPEQQVSGKLRVWGNNYIGDSNLADYWQREFNGFQPGIVIEYNLPSAAVAVPSLYFSLADIGMDHNPTFYDFLGHLRVFGVVPVGISVVNGHAGGYQAPLVVVVPKANPLHRLTIQQLDGIFGSSRAGGWVQTQWHPEVARGSDKDIRTWGQLGLTGEWADKQIHPCGFSVRYATGLEFSNKVLGGSDKWAEDYLAYGNWKRPDGTVVGEAGQIVAQLKSDRYSIGYLRGVGGFGATDAGKYLKPLALAKDADGPYVLATLDTEHDRSYPLWADQSFWISPPKPGEKLDPKIREFIRYTLSQEGQRQVERDGKYVPLDSKTAAEELDRLNSM